MELNRRHNCFDELQFTEKILRFSGGLTEYFPPNPQLVKNLVRNRVYEKIWLRTEFLGNMGYKLGSLKKWVINRGI